MEGVDHLLPVHLIESVVAVDQEDGEALEVEGTVEMGHAFRASLGTEAQLDAHHLFAELGDRSGRDAELEGPLEQA